VIMALTHMPLNTYQPNSVLNQCASMLISQSQDKDAAEHGEEAPGTARCDGSSAGGASPGLAGSLSI
jgi:hypothetical protein